MCSSMEKYDELLLVQVHLDDKRFQTYLDMGSLGSSVLINLKILVRWCMSPKIKSTVTIMIAYVVSVSLSVVTKPHFIDTWH